ncbi:MAG TPA: ModD protein [Rhodoblastus sp.]|nr:ModD protein [Rhodoblastus sp.]
MPTIHDDELARILRDDCPSSDPTTEGLGIGRIAARATLTARHDMTVCAVEQAARMFELSGASARVVVASGARAAAGSLLLEAHGAAGGLHRAYKMAQTLMEILSGIATATRAIVDAAHSANPHCRVVCTRKHMPGMKRWALHAIETGGAAPHRLGLSDYVLVFGEHRSLLDKDVPLAEHFRRLKAFSPERRLAAEASEVEEAALLAEAGAEIVQVDKMTPDQVAATAARLAAFSPRPLLAAAGGVNAGNAAAYAAAGADLLVTSSPYLAPPRDVKVTIVPA